MEKNMVEDKEYIYSRTVLTENKCQLLAEEKKAEKRFPSGLQLQVLQSSSKKLNKIKTM